MFLLANITDAKSKQKFGYLYLLFKKKNWNQSQRAHEKLLVL